MMGWSYSVPSTISTPVMVFSEGILAVFRIKRRRGCPRAKSSLTTQWPIKPLPPVKNIFILSMPPF